MAQAYLQMNFKNQIMNLNGLLKMDEVAKYLQKSPKYSDSLQFIV